MSRLSPVPTVDRLRDWLRDDFDRVAALPETALARAREGFEWRRLAFAVAALFAFTVPFAASAARDEPAPAPAGVLEPPAAAAAPALPGLSKVAALPVPPKPAPPRPRRTPSQPAPAAPVPAAPAAPVATPAPVVSAPAPAPPAPPAPSRERFDLEG
jgi:hypothetical protein